MIVYPNADVVQYFYLNSLLNRPNHEAYPKNELRRFTIDVSAGTVSSRRLADYSAELPRINYKQCNGKTYQYVYAAASKNRVNQSFLTVSSNSIWRAMSGSGSRRVNTLASLCMSHGQTLKRRMRAYC